MNNNNVLVVAAADVSDHNNGGKPHNVYITYNSFPFFTLQWEFFFSNKTQNRKNICNNSKLYENTRV